MLAVAQSRGKAGALSVPIVAADEFATVVGLPGQIAQRHVPTVQVLLNASSEDGAGRRRTFLSEGPEEQSAADFARGVFDQRQTQALSLGPEPRDIAKILGIGGDLLEQPPGGFDGGQVLFALIFLSAFADQSVRAPDALHAPILSGARVPAPPTSAGTRAPGPKTIPIRLLASDMHFSSARG